MQPLYAVQKVPRRFLADAHEIGIVLTPLLEVVGYTRRDALIPQSPRPLRPHRPRAVLRLATDDHPIQPGKLTTIATPA